MRGFPVRLSSCVDRGGLGAGESVESALTGWYKRLRFLASEVQQSPACLHSRHDRRLRLRCQRRGCRRGLRMDRQPARRTVGARGTLAQPGRAFASEAARSVVHGRTGRTLLRTGRALLRLNEQCIRNRVPRAAGRLQHRFRERFRTSAQAVVPDFRGGRVLRRAGRRGAGCAGWRRGRARRCGDGDAGDLVA